MKYILVSFDKSIDDLDDQEILGFFDDKESMDMVIREFVNSLQTNDPVSFHQIFDDGQPHMGYFALSDDDCTGLPLSGAIISRVIVAQALKQYYRDQFKAITLSEI